MAAADGTAGGRSRLWFIGLAAVVLLLAGLGVWALAASGDDEPSTPGGPAPGPTTATPAAPGGPATAPVATTASIKLTVAVTPTVRTVLVEGSGFGAGEVVVLLVDDQELSRTNADAAGAFRASVRLPNERRSFLVRATGSTSGRSATATATV